jgi:hypothetical protein
VIFGCEQDQLGIALINELSSNKFSFNENLLLKLKAEYSKLS